MKIWGFIILIAGLMNLYGCYMVATDKIKPTKSTLLLYYIMVTMALFSLAFKTLSS